MSNMYTLLLINTQGASDLTRHQTKTAIRKYIRTWQKGMNARVLDSDGKLIYEGSAYRF